MRLPLLCTALLTASLAAPQAFAGTASFLVVHGIPGRDVGPGIDPALPVDVQINGSLCLLKNFTFGQIAGPFDVPTGTYSVAVSLANPISPCSNAAVISANVTLTDGEFGAIAAQLSSTGAPTAGVYPVNVSTIPTGNQRIMVAHAANAPTVLVKALPPGKTKAAAKFFLQPGTTKSVEVPKESGYSVSISAGPASFGPIDFTGGNQSLFFAFAVGNASTGSVTLLGKTLPSVF